MTTPRTPLDKKKAAPVAAGRPDINHLEGIEDAATA